MASIDQAESSGGNIILVVEDNPQAAKLMCLYLIKAGYRVMVAGSGAEALLLAQQYRPMAITLDLLLPDMDGWQVLSELKAMPGTSNIPVVIVSVLDRQLLGFRLGASDYLVKPVDRTELLQALRRCVPHEGESGVLYKVMVVHTDPEELNLLAMMLAQENYEVIQALGTAEAANLARCAHPDLVVINLMAGEVDFFGLMELLKAAPDTAQIPVLALTTRVVAAAGEQAPGVGRIEFVLLRENEMIEERLLDAITMLLRRIGVPSDEN